MVLTGVDWTDVVVVCLSRERERARGVKWAIRLCWGGMAAGGCEGGRIGEERKFVVADGGKRAAGSIR